MKTIHKILRRLGWKTAAMKAETLRRSESAKRGWAKRKGVGA